MAEFIEVMNGVQKLCNYLHENRYKFNSYVCDACEEKFPSTYEFCRYSCRALSLETLKSTETEVQQFLKDHPDPVYPTWIDWLRDNASKPIAKDIAKKLGIEPIDPREEEK